MVCLGIFADLAVFAQGGPQRAEAQAGRGRIARVIFCAHEGQMVLLHGFVKKTRKTPKGDLDLATNRMKEIT